MQDNPDIGQLDRIVTIQVNAGGTDAMGSPREAWSEDFSAWAKIEDARGRDERHAAGEAAALDQVRFILRHSSQSDAVAEGTHRVKLGDDHYNIKQVQPSPASRPRWVVLHCERRPA